jgi:hypothetical protein
VTESPPPTIGPAQAAALEAEATRAENKALREALRELQAQYRPDYPLVGWTKRLWEPIDALLERK